MHKECIMDKGNSTSECSSRSSLRDRIIDVVLDDFTSQGIRSVTMDEVATKLGISKRTLYEVFADKEALLVDCILKLQGNADAYAKGVYDQAADVLEVLLKCYQYSIERLHKTNRKFFEELKRYPKAYDVLSRHQHRDTENVVNFFKRGVEQGLFRDDINYAIVNLLVHEQLNMLMNSEVCKEYPFLEVYESIMVTYIRGISTEKGARRLDEFMKEFHRSKKQE